MYRFKILITSFLVFTFIFSFILLVFADETNYVWSDEEIIATNAELEQAEEEKNDNDNSNKLNLESPSAILIEQTTGQILYEHNAHEQ